MRDGLHALTHDHGELNRRVLDLSALVAAAEPGSDLLDALVELREELFAHFAREEEGLFPYITAELPELASRVLEMAFVHDTVCGALSRACHTAERDASRAQLVALYERFEQAYAGHARAESDFLEELQTRLTEGQRVQLSELVAGL
ncbi:MAG TPA: hemerythrin domain-containing protein [Kofleriaceae bacterium]